MIDTNQLPPKPFLRSSAIVAALLLTGVIGWMIESRAQVLRDGQEAVLQTEPIDPRDLLRGRYVVLNYAIARPDPDVVRQFFETLPDDRFYRDETIYVALAMGEDGFHNVSAISLKKPEEGLFLRARASFTPNLNGDLRANYGIGRFYTNEKLAPELEARMRNGETTIVVVAVDANGTAQIKAFQQDGVNIVTERLY
ncbi:MAG: GDYXXLXY domain-containing protein [Pseudomonadota bacterium]